MNTKGPDPVTSEVCWLIGVSATALGMMNSGTDDERASADSIRPSGSLRAISKVLSSTAFISRVNLASRPPIASLSVQRLIEGMTSADVTGVPSCHLSPSRNVKIQVSLSSLVFQLSTICGCGFRLASSAKSWS